MPSLLRLPVNRFSLVSLLLALLLRLFVADLGPVVGGSMQGTLLDGDWILTNRLAFGLQTPRGGWLLRWAGPRRGSVVILLSPLDGKRLVKRVVGVPGDRLCGKVVPPGCYYVLGDNRPHSLDSRSFGCVPGERILGGVVGVAFSFERGSWKRPRWQRFLQGVGDEPEA